MTERAAGGRRISYPVALLSARLTGFFQFTLRRIVKKWQAETPQLKAVVVTRQLLVVR